MGFPNLSQAFKDVKLSNQLTNLTRAKEMRVTNRWLLRDNFSKGKSWDLKSGRGPSRSKGRAVDVRTATSSNSSVLQLNIGMYGRWGIRVPRGSDDDSFSLNLILSLSSGFRFGLA